MFRNKFSIRKERESGLPPLLQKKQCESAKSDVPKVLFPGIGKITNRVFEFLIFLILWML